MLVEAAEIASYAGDVTPTAELGRRAAALPVVDKAGEFLSDLLQGMGRVAEGDGEHGGPLLRRAIALAGTLQDPRRLMWAGIAAFFLGETEAGNALYIRAVARARQEGAVGLLPQALEYLAPVELSAGRYDAATASATEGLRLARDTGNDTSACRHLCTLAHLAALRGDEDTCRALAAEALERAAARGLGLIATLAGYALATLELGQNRPAEALARLERLLAAGPGAGSPFFAAYTVPDLVEAAVRSGRPEAATGPLAAFEQLAALAGTAEPLAQLARCRGLLAPDDEAAAHFEEALARHEGSGPPSTWPGPSWPTGRRCAGPGVGARPAPTCARPWGPSSGWGRRRGPSGPGPSCGRPARPPAGATPPPSASSPPRSCRSSGWSARAGPTARSALSCSSAAAPSTTTCATCS
jgi:tetratricopeptide (TPR) repeat protein